MNIILISIIAVAILALLIFSLRKRSQKKVTHRVNFTIINKALPRKKLYQVNYIHNKDVIPSERKPTIKSYVI